MKLLFFLLIIFFISGCGDIVNDTKAWLEPAPQYTDFDFKSLSSAQEAAAKRIREKTSTDFVADWNVVMSALPQPHISRKLGIGPSLIRMTEHQVIQLLGQPSSYKRKDEMKCLNFEFGDSKGITTTGFILIKDFYVFWFGSAWGTTREEIKKPEPKLTTNLIPPLKQKKKSLANAKNKNKKINR